MVIEFLQKKQDKQKIKKIIWILNKYDHFLQQFSEYKQIKSSEFKRNLGEIKKKVNNKNALDHILNYQNKS